MARGRIAEGERGTEEHSVKTPRPSTVPSVVFEDEPDAGAGKAFRFDDQPTRIVLPPPALLKMSRRAPRRETGIYGGFFLGMLAGAIAVWFAARDVSRDVEHARAWTGRVLRSLKSHPTDMPVDVAPDMAGDLAAKPPPVNGSDREPSTAAATSAKSKRVNDVAPINVEDLPPASVDLSAFPQDMDRTAAAAAMQPADVALHDMKSRRVKRELTE